MPRGVRARDLNRALRGIRWIGNMRRKWRRVAALSNAVTASGMKIAMVTDWFHPRVGGIEVHVQALALRLRERGHEVTVITPWPGPTAISGIRVVRMPIRLVAGLGVS